MIGDNYYPRHWADLMDYRKEITSEGASISGFSKKTDMELDIQKMRLTIGSPSGFDGDNNIYFLFGDNALDKFGILVCSKYGEILDAFYTFDRDRPEAFVHSITFAVAPNGDLYFLSFKDPNYAFYRLRRRW